MNTPCKKDEDWNTKWGPAGKTASLKAAQDCFDRGYYDAKVDGCGDWKFKATCSNQIPEGWSKPYSTETAQEEGYSDRDAAMVADCQRRGYGAVSNPGPDKIRFKGGNVWPDSYYSMQCISQAADPTECCLENNYQTSEVKTIRDTTCDPMYRGVGNVGCQNVMRQQCSIDNFTTDARMNQACRNYMESPTGGEVVRELTRSYMNKYSPSQVVVNALDNSNLTNYLMQRCTSTGACEPVLTEKCSNYNMDNISQDLYSLKKQLAAINQAEPARYYIQYSGIDVPVTQTIKDDNGRDIHFAPVVFNGQKSFLMYNTPTTKLLSSSSNPSFELWKNNQATIVTGTLADKSNNADARRQVIDRIEGHLMTLKWCGCHFPSNQYIDQLEGKIECDIKCKTSGVQRFIAGQKQVCRDTICVVDVANIAISGSDVKDFNINQECGNNGTGPAQCYVNLGDFTLDSTEVENFAAIQQNCGNATKAAALTLMSSQDRFDYLKDYEGPIPGRSVLLFLIVITTTGLLLSISTMFISPLIGLPILTLTIFSTVIYLIVIRDRPLRLLQN